MTYYDYSRGYSDGAYQQHIVDQAAINNLRSERDDALDDSNRRLFKLSAANKTIREKDATIAALQQSLDEATAKINSNTPETFINYPVKRRTFAPQPEPIKVGDVVKYPNGKNRYIVEHIFAADPGSLYPDNPKIRIRSLAYTGGTFYARPKNLVKLS